MKTIQLHHIDFFFVIKSKCVSPEVIVPDGSVVLLASRVQDVYLHLLAVQHHFFAVTVCLRGLVVLNKLQKQGCEREAKQHMQSQSLERDPLPKIKDLWLSAFWPVSDARDSAIWLIFCLFKS